MFENYSPKLPKGLDRFHVFKDKVTDNKFYLIEYWNSMEAKNNMEKSETFETLSKIHHFAKERSSERIECDVII
jgi:quinol monooxygenase YgiN